MSKEVESELLKLADKYLAEIDPPVLPESPAPKIQSNEIRALALAIEHMIFNMANNIEAEFNKTNTAIMQISKLGLTKH